MLFIRENCSRKYSNSANKTVQSNIHWRKFEHGEHQNPCFHTPLMRCLFNASTRVNNHSMKISTQTWYKVNIDDWWNVVFVRFTWIGICECVCECRCKWLHLDTNENRNNSEQSTFKTHIIYTEISLDQMRWIKRCATEKKRIRFWMWWFWISDAS